MGLSHRCEILVKDYRDIPELGEFDKIASVGMVEHVGRDQLPCYFDAAYRALRPGGQFLNHGIVCSPAETVGRRAWFREHLWREGEFVERYIFPDGELHPVNAVVRAAEEAGFELRDVENLREHYALTLHHWLRHLEASHDQAADLVGEATYRAWRIWMAGAAQSFAAGRLGLIQALFAKTAANGAADLPVTRADLYRSTGRAR